MIIGEKLQKLLENNNSNRLCTEIINLTNNEDWVNDMNYLDIAISNPNKISYITKDRINRFNVEITKLSEELIGKQIKLKKIFCQLYFTPFNITKIKEIKNASVVMEGIYDYLLQANDIVNGVRLFKKYTISYMKPEWFNEELRVKFAYMTSPGKIINKLGIQASCKEIEEFSKLFYKDEMLLNIEGLRFEVVKGNDIQRYYNEHNYSRIAGTLGSSCMRYDGCEDYFNIYTENPDVVNMLVLFDSSDLIEGRALVWKCKEIVDGEDITLMDRIYVTDDNYVQLFRSYAQKHNWHYKYRDCQSYKTECMCPPNYDKEVSLRLEVKLETKWDRYPYVDTFTYCNYGVLSNRDNGCAKTLDDTNGGPNDENYVYSEWHDEDILECDAVYSDTLGTYIREDEAVYVEVYRNWDHMPSEHDSIVEIKGTYYHAETSCKYSDYNNDWILKGEAIYLDYISDWVTEEDIIYSEYESMNILNDDAVYSEYHNSEMLRHTCELLNGDWIHKDCVKEYLNSIKEEENAEVITN